MQINATEAVRNMLSYTLATDRDSLIKLLERNGIVVPQNPSDREITASVLLASAKSANFKQELSRLLTSKVPQAADDYAPFVGDSTDFGFTGIDDFSFVGEDEFFNQTGTDKPKIRDVRKQAKTGVKLEAAKKGEKTGFGKFLSNLGQAISSPETINAGLNVGLTAVNNRVQGRSNAIQQETAVITQQSDQIKQELGKQKGRGLGTGAIIGITVGVIALVGIIYYVVKKK